MNRIAVLIATSLGRIEPLFNRALPSVFSQTRKPDYITIVDDNTAPTLGAEIAQRIERIKNDTPFPNITYLKNTRTKGMSGTGSWNTGFAFYTSILDNDDFFAILDDDDSWDNTYLEKCAHCFEKEKLDQIIAFIQWNKIIPKPLTFTKNDICIEAFLKGNPGVQGSNLFLSVSAIKRTGGFDETLSSCTDRDFMITFLSCLKAPRIHIIEEVLVHHFVEKESVTTNPHKKEAGLDTFYKKHIHRFSKDMLTESLLRAKKLFSYKNGANIEKLYALSRDVCPKIVIGVALHNNAQTVRNTLCSILTQTNVESAVHILLVNDSSTDTWKENIDDLLEQKNILVWNVNFSSAVQTRNYINQFIKTYFKNTQLIGRLDADDTYASHTALSEIERLYKKTKADYIIAGNYLKANGVRLKKVNRATTRYLDHTYLLAHLKQMAEGTAENELPSCSLFMTPQSLLEYPNKKSAEDHFLVARILWNKENRNVVIAEDILPIEYNLDGNLTKSNKKEKLYRSSRKELWEEMQHYAQ